MQNLFELFGGDAARDSLPELPDKKEKIAADLILPFFPERIREREVLENIVDEGFDGRIETIVEL